MDNDPVVIVGVARTPMGGFQGDFASLTASELGAVAIKAAVERAGILPSDVEKTIFGCVLPAGQGQAPAAPRWRPRCSRTIRSWQAPPM